MALASNDANTWQNSDGLRVRFGTDQAEKPNAGSKTQAGAMTEHEFIIDYRDMRAFSVNQLHGGLPTVALRAGWLLKSAVLTIITPFDSSGDALTLTLGTCTQDGTVVDEDGIDAAVAQSAIDAVGDEIVCDGDLVGTLLASDQFLTVLANTATATAGRARLVITMMAP